MIYGSFTSSVFLAATAALFALPLNSVAQGDSDPHYTVEAELTRTELIQPELVVTGTQEDTFYDPSQVDLKTYTGFVTRIERQEFAHRLAQANEVIANNSNVQIRNAGGLGSFSALAVRGSSFNQVNIFLDGMLLNDAQYGSADINLIPTALIQSINIYPDTTPVQLGNASLAGAINIESLTSFDKNYTQASIGAGSFNTAKADLSLARSFAGWNAVLSAAHISSDNDFEFENTQGRRFILDGTRIENQQNAEYQQNTLFGKVSKVFANKLQLQWLSIYSNTNNGVPSLANNSDNTSSNQSDASRHIIKLNRNFSNWSISQQIRTSSQETLFNNANGRTNQGLFSSESNNVGYFGLLEKDLGDSLLSASLDLQKEQYSDIELLERNDTVDSERILGVAALEFKQWFFQTALQSTSAARYYDANNSAEKKSSRTLTNDFNTQDNAYHSSWQQGFSYQVNPAFLLKLNLSEQVRLPSLFELFGNQNGVLGAVDLKTEESKNIDFGFLWQPYRNRYNIALFSKTISNGIFLEVDSNGIGRYRNIGRATIKGVEFDSLIHLGNAFTLKILASKLDSENKSPIKAINGKQLQGLFHNSFRSTLSWERSRQLKLLVSYSWNNEFYYDEVNSPDQGLRDSLSTIDASLVLSSNHTTVDFSVRNLRDVPQFDFDRYPSPGRSFTVTVTHQL